MAQIDLRNAVITIEDGYDGPGGTPLVNNGAGYSSTDTTMVVDGFSGAVANFDRFTVTGSTAVHQITSHSQTLGNTTSITFTPGLTGSVADDAAITMLPHSLEITIGEGNLSYDESRQFKYTLDRGNLDTVKQLDDVPVEVKLDATWEFLKASTGDEPTIEDVLKKRGEASAWISSSSDACEPYAVNIKVVYTPPCGGEDTETILLDDFRWEKFGHDLKQGQLAVSGKCNITDATVSRG